MKHIRRVLLLALLCCLSYPCWSAADRKIFYGEVIAESAPYGGGFVYVSRAIPNGIGWYTSVEDENTIKQKVLTDGKST